MKRVVASRVVPSLWRRGRILAVVQEHQQLTEMKEAVSSSPRNLMPFVAAVPFGPNLSLNQSQNRWFSDDSKSKTPAANGSNVTLEDRDVEDMEPNEEAHPDSTLKGNRDLYTVPVTIKMPDMSEGDDNMVGEWFKKPGDVIKYNDVLCDITTQDFTFGMVTEDEHDAIMGDILVEAGQKAADGAPICIIYHPVQEEKTKEKVED